MKMYYLFPVAMLFLCGACTPKYYLAEAPFVPILEEKGDVAASISSSVVKDDVFPPVQCNAIYAYDSNKSVFVTMLTNVKIAKGFFALDEPNSFYMFEAGTGWFQNPGQHIGFAEKLGFGYGKFSVKPDRQEVLIYGILKPNVELQGFIRSKHVILGGSTKASALHYILPNNADTNDRQFMRHSPGRELYGMADPAIYYGLYDKHWQFTAHMIWTHELRDISWDYYTFQAGYQLYIFF
ncbi:MAG: hypothetical protein R2794_12335 [Chitinophagales bacterium]